VPFFTGSIRSASPRAQVAQFFKVWSRHVYFASSPDHRFHVDPDLVGTVERLRFRQQARNSLSSQLFLKFAGLTLDLFLPVSDFGFIREELLFHGVEPVIPSKINRREAIAHDREAYLEHNLIERLFNKLKNWRRIATRFDKTALSFLSFIQIISAKFWIPFVNRT
jgi:hypothetical protein